MLWHSTNGITPDSTPSAFLHYHKAEKQYRASPTIRSVHPRKGALPNARHRLLGSCEKILEKFDF
jgi:hypothetical protein